MSFDTRNIFYQFQVYSDFIASRTYGNGHINDTFLVTVDQGGRELHYILQRINHHIFKDPVALMDNVYRICTETRRRLEEQGFVDISRRTLTTLLSRDGLPYVRDKEGNTWRLYYFIEGAIGYDVVRNSDQAYQAAFAFGTFQKFLTDMKGPRLNETIPHFHDTPRRFSHFLEVLQKDPVNRKKTAEQEIEKYLSYEDKLSRLTKLQAAGEIPERITHNDTKLNNVLIDVVTNEAVCVIDLDTSMPGLTPYDFGDLVRTSTSPAAEDERDLIKVRILPEMFKALARGYLDATADFLLPVERENLVFGAKIMTYEVGLRFLTDYLEGDIYFKTAVQDHNLVRSRTQMKLLNSLEEQEGDFEKMILSARQNTGNWYSSSSRAKRNKNAT